MRTLHRIALACLALAACAPPPMPTPPAPPPPQGRAAVLAQCSTTAGPTGADTATATEGGATLRVGSGGVQHMLQVPPGGAKPGTVFVLTALRPPRVGVEAHVQGQDTVTFPDGRPATLHITGQHCTEAEWGKLTSPTIVRIERDGALTVLPSQIGSSSGRVLRTELPSLSGYAIGGS